MSAQHPTLYVDPDDVARLDATTVVPATRYRDAASDVEYVPASALDDLRAENERLRRERNAKVEPEHPDFKHQSPRVAIEVWNKRLRNALGLLTHNEHPINETADAVGDVLHLVSVLREQVEALRRERDEARATTILAVSGVSAVDALKAMTAERDEWKAKAEQCDDCENFAGIRVCTGCWAKHVAAARDAARARVAELEAQVADIKRGLRDALENWDNSRRASACTACRGSGGTCDAGGNLTEPCVGCGGSGSEVVRLTNYVAHIEKWKANAELVGLRAIEERLAAEAAVKADQTRIAALALAMGHARDTLGSLGCIGHEGDEESGAHDPDCRGCAVEASVAHIEDALSGGTNALDAVRTEDQKKIAALSIAMTSIHDALAFSSRDHSVDHRDAWIYGIACGWDDEAMAELVAAHKWTPDAVERLRALRLAVEGGTSALDVHDAALREEIAREVESHAEDVDSMHWRQAHRIIAQRIVAGADVLATIRAKGGK